MVEVLNKGCESCFEYVRTGFEPFHCDTVPPTNSKQLSHRPLPSTAK
jgi:hypothetical protein